MSADELLTAVQVFDDESRFTVTFTIGDRNYHLGLLKDSRPDDVARAMHIASMAIGDPTEGGQHANGYDATTHGG